MGYTLAEKILMRNTGKTNIRPGDLLITRPDRIMYHDIYTPFVYDKFNEMGFKKVHDPDKVIIILDHLIPTNFTEDVRHLEYGYKFAEEYGIKNFIAGGGICHHLMPEQGYAKPGNVVFASDSHTTTYGGISCFATGIGYTEVAAAIGTGELWVKVPEAIKICIDGKLPPGVYAKDIILKILGDIKSDGGTYKSIEFSGSTVRELSIESRMTISNMIVEAGGKVGLFEADEKTAEYCGMDMDEISWLTADPDADYEKEIFYDAALFEPQIACPPYVDNVKPLSDIAGLKLDQVFFGSCTNGKLEDFKIVAEILKGKKIASGLKFIVTPATVTVFKDAIKHGYIKVIVEAGGVVTHPSCSLCCGRAWGLASANENVLGTNNRNFLGRMGPSSVDIYLSSPAVAAASALEGKISMPEII